MKKGDIVYVLGKRTLLGSGEVIKAKVSHIKHRQWVAYTVGDEPGEWSFSKKHIGRAVFDTKEAAEAALKGWVDNHEMRKVQ